MKLSQEKVSNGGEIGVCMRLHVLREVCQKLMKDHFLLLDSGKQRILEPEKCLCGFNRTENLGSMSQCEKNVKV